jgi:hypothetical protein
MRMEDLVPGDVVEVHPNKFGLIQVMSVHSAIVTDISPKSFGQYFNASYLDVVSVVIESPCRPRYFPIASPGMIWSSNDRVIDTSIAGDRLSVTVQDSSGNLSVHDMFSWPSPQTYPPSTQSQGVLSKQQQAVGITQSSSLKKSLEIDCTCDTKILVSYGCQCSYAKSKRP